MCKCTFDIIEGRYQLVYHGGTEYRPDPVPTRERDHDDADVQVQDRALAVDLIGTTNDLVPESRRRRGFTPMTEAEKKKFFNDNSR